MSEGFIDVTTILRGGVYALLHRGIVVYIGQSRVMLTRLSSHRSAWGRKNPKPQGNKPIRGMLFDAVWVWPKGPDDIDALEQRLIDQYKPRYNTIYKTDVPPDVQEIIAQLIGIPVPSAPALTIRRR